jgi:uncharacterized protein (TIGR02271 family)
VEYNNVEMDSDNESTTIEWDNVIKKEARGADDYDLGEVQEVTDNHILTQKGIMEKKWFQIPKHLAQGFDGNKLILNIIESDAKNLYVIDEPPSPPNDEMQNDNSETTVPLIEERLEPTKREVVEEAKIIKEPVRETKQVEMDLTHEELVIERKPLDEPRPTDQNPVESRTEIKIPLKREEIEVNKQSYVKEEIIARKKPITETRTVSEEVTSEKVEELGKE